MASEDLNAYLRSLGLTDAQIAALIAAAGGTEGPVGENDIAVAAARYAAALASGQLNAPTVANPGGPTTPSTTDGGASAPSAPSAQVPGVATPGGAPLLFPMSAGAQGIQDTWQGMNTGFLANPYATVAPTNDPRNASPEASLPGMAYAGTVGASALTPEQAAGIQYDTPEFRAYIAAQLASSGTPNDPRINRDSVYNTVNNLTNAYRSGAYAGNPADLNSAIASTVDAQYLEWIGNFGLNPQQAAAQGLTKQKFVDQMGTFKSGYGASPTLNGVSVMQPVYNSAGSGPAGPSVAQYGPPPAPPAAAAPAAAPGAPAFTAPNAGVSAMTPEFLAANQRYIANLLAVPAGQRSAAQNTSLAAAYAKIGQAPAPAPPVQASAPPAYSGGGGGGGGVVTGAPPQVPPPPPPPVQVTATGLPMPPPNAGFIAANQGYVANLSAVPAAQRTAAQNSSLAAALAKLKPYNL